MKTISRILLIAMLVNLVTINVFAASSTVGLPNKISATDFTKQYTSYHTQLLNQNNLSLTAQNGTDYYDLLNLLKNINLDDPQVKQLLAGKDETVVTHQKFDYNTQREMYMAIAFSTAAYYSTKEQPSQISAKEWQLLGEQGWNPTLKEIGLGNQYIYGTKTEDGVNYYVIGFRGTHYWYQWVLDGTAVPVKFSNTSDHVHLGFDLVTLTAEHDKDLNAFLSKFRADRNAKLIITGHSLGGAEASIYAAWLLNAKGIREDRMSLINLAAPCVGQKDFCDEFGSVMTCDRFVDPLDIVPVVCKLVGVVAGKKNQYYHFGTRINTWDLTDPDKALQNLKTLVGIIKSGDMKKAGAFIGANHVIEDYYPYSMKYCKQYIKDKHYEIWNGSTTSKSSSISSNRIGKISL